MANPNTAVFPGRAAVDSDLFVASDKVATTLTAPVGGGDTTITVASTTGIFFPTIINIDNEQIACASATSTVITVASSGRGFNGTTVTSHLSGAAVNCFVDSYYTNQLAAEVKAIENLITNPPIILPFTCNFAAQTPGGTLTATIGASVTLTPVPVGVNASDSNHYLYISAGTGTAEAVLITGGTAVSGAASGTVQFTPAHSHSGAWTIQSASGGIQEQAIASGVGNNVKIIPTGATPIKIYAPVTFLDGQNIDATSCIIERNFSFAGNVFNLIGTIYGGLVGGRFTVNGSFSEPTNSYKVYCLNILYLYLDNVEISGGWGGIFFDHIVRGTASNLRGDNFSGDFLRLGSHTNGATGMTITNVTTSDGTGTGTAFHAKYGLVQLTNFDFQGLNGQAATSRGIYIDADSTDFFDQSIFTNGIIDSMNQAIVVNPSISRFIQVNFSDILITGDGTAIDLPVVCEEISLNNLLIIGGSGTSGTILVRGVNNLSINNVQIIQQSLAGISLSLGIGFLGNSTNVLITNCQIGFTGTPAIPNTNVGGCIYFATATYLRVLIENNLLAYVGASGITITTPSTGITVRNNPIFNPIGVSAITVGSSPFTYTAGNSPEEIYIFAGTVSSITRGGTQIATASPSRVFLPPNGSLIITYSSLPTMVKDIQ